MALSEQAVRVLADRASQTERMVRLAQDFARKLQDALAVPLPMWVDIDVPFVSDVPADWIEWARVTAVAQMKGEADHVDDR